MLQRLTQQYQAAAAESLRRMPKNGNATEEAMRQWAEGFARRMVHVPMKGLRSLAASAGPAAVQAYLDGVEEALAANEESKDISKEKRS
jgi:gamma-glutamylcysteine synthetase